MFDVRLFVDGREVPKEIPRPHEWETCLFCDDRFDLSNLHPGHVKAFGRHPKICRRCGLCFEPYGKIWSADIESRIIKAKLGAGKPRTCFMCGKQFNLLGSFYRHMEYKSADGMDSNIGDSNPEWGCWISSDGLDFLYPNLYTAICPACFQNLFWQYREGDVQDQLAAMRELGEKLGKLPVRNFHTYIYTYHDKSEIEWFLGMLKRLPISTSINERFGSYFKLLLQSGLLPEGTRRMRLGTWTLSLDGDMCFSLAERNIDDWLFRHKIAHTKEVRYPKSDMRCDWEILRDGHRIFIEYFGLMNRATYAAKSEMKRRIAMENSIELIGIMPETDWEKLLAKRFLE